MSSHLTVIPEFALYGESTENTVPEPLHCESIAARSRLHNWKIKPHRHRGLIQIFYLQSGHCSAQLDENVIDIRPPAIIIVTAMSVHGFDFAVNEQGYVLSLAEPLARKLMTRLGGQQKIFTQSSVLQLGQVRPPQLDQLFANIHRDYSTRSEFRQLMLESLLSQLFIWVVRHEPKPSPDRPGNTSRSAAHLSRFYHTLDTNFRNKMSIRSYAAAVGISAAHLNHLCQLLTGKSTLQLVHERKLLEAKRNLIYTSMTISQIAHTLGFSEPAYFSRFFKRQTGVNPKQYRAAGALQHERSL